MIGWEGFVGTYVLDGLIRHQAYKHIKLIAQKKPPIKNPKIEVVLSPIEKVDLSKQPADDLFICYDSSFFNTGGKYAIPRDSYRYIPDMLWQARKNKVGQVILLSSKGADTEANLSTNRIRGLIEDAVAGMGYWSTHIFKPGILIGESLPQKWGQELADQMSEKIDSFTGGWLRRNKPIEAEVVARAMVEVAQKLQPGLHKYTSTWLQDYALVNKRTEIKK